MSLSFSARARGRFAIAALVAAAVSSAGCTSALLTGALLMRGLETPAEFEDLEGKKVAVVCRPLVELQYSSSDAADLLARDVGNRMKEKVKKINLVSAQKVEQWSDEHEWDEYPQVGKALKTDYVVGLELEEFSLYQGQTIYQGRARVKITVHDMKKDGDVVYEKLLDRIVYPPNGGVATSDKTEPQFRREFTAVVAERIGRSFYGFDPRDDYAMDSRTLD
jgi:hypothetical protein